MTAFNFVRFRVKPGREEEFVSAHREAEASFAGMRRFARVKTGERAYCVVGERDDMASLAGAREQMIALLNSFPDTLEDLGGGLCVADPVSGDVVVEMRGPGGEFLTATGPLGAAGAGRLGFLQPV